MDLNTTEFNDVIKKIRIKRRIIGILITLSFIGIIFSFPMYLEILGDVIINHSGAPTLIVVFLIVILICLIAYVFISVPIHNTLLNECNARKYIVMLTALEKEKSIYSMLATGYFYLGDFDTGVYYCNKTIESKSQYAKLTGLFGRARCEYFAGKYENFQQNVLEFNNLLSASRLNKKQQAIIIRYQCVINLFSAILNKDNLKIKEFASNLQPWEDTKIVVSFINYLKGLAAYELGDKKECNYRFMAVCDVASKTVLGALSKKYLSNPQGEEN